MRTVKYVVALMAAPVTVLALPVAAHAAVVGADVHGWISGANEVWAGKSSVDMVLTYRATQVSMGSAPGFVDPVSVEFDIRDPSGHSSTAVSVTYQYFTEFRPVPIVQYGPLDPFNADHSRGLKVAAASSAVGGTWRIRPHITDFNWELNGANLAQYPETINRTEDWYSFVVHPTAPGTAAPSRTSTNRLPASQDPARRTAGPTMGVAASAAGLTDPSAAAGHGSGATSDAAQTQAIGRNAAVGSDSRSWILYGVAALAGAALLGGFMLARLLRARRRA